MIELLADTTITHFQFKNPAITSQLLLNPHNRLGAKRGENESKDNRSCIIQDWKKIYSRKINQKKDKIMIFVNHYTATFQRTAR